MRVAYVCADPGVPVWGVKGCSLHVQEIIRALLDRGAVVELFCVRAGGLPPPDLVDVATNLVPVGRGDSVAQRERALLQANETLRQALERSGPFDLLYERHALWSFAAAEYAANRGLPAIVEVNAPLIDEQATHRQLVGHNGAAAATCRSFRSAHLVAAVSAAVADYAVSRGASPERVAVVPNGVRTDLFVPSRPAVVARDPFTIGFVGGLRPWHAVDDLISAFASFKEEREFSGNAQLRIVGDGPLRQELAGQINRLPLQVQDSIQLVGAVAPEAIPAWLQKLDVAVAPYASDADCYFSPLKIFEYLAAGVAIVAAAAGQLCQLIEHERTGLLYRAGDRGALAGSLARLGADRQLARRLGREARREAVARHSWQKRVDQMLAAVRLGCRSPE